MKLLLFIKLFNIQCFCVNMCVYTHKHLIPCLEKLQEVKTIIQLSDLKLT